MGEHYISAAGKRFFYRQSGSGAPIVFLHGIPTHSGLWDGVIPCLDKFYSVYAFDLLGFGKSDKPSSDEINIKSQAGLLLEAFRDMGLKDIVLVGHDIGGGICQVMAVMSPRMFKAMVLVDSACYDSWPIDILRTEKKVKMLFEHLPPDVIHELFYKYIGGGLYDTSKSSRIAKKYSKYIEGKGEIEGFLEVVKSLDNKYTIEVSSMLGTIRMPTLILWGRHDKYIRFSYAYRLSEDIRNSVIEVIEDAGHFSPEEKPQEVGNIIRVFLSKSMQVL